MPLISVIVPVYNVEPYLRRCIDSILEQTFGDFELILVDDGSPDGCPAICDEYATADSRVHVIHQANGGLSAARNSALDWVFEKSTSKYITFIDSDDWISNNYLDIMMQGVRLGHRIVCVEMDVINEGRERNNDVAPPDNWCEASPEEYWVHLGKYSTTACGKLFERVLYKDIRFPVGKIHEDEFTTYLVLFSIPTVAYVSAPLYHYFRHVGSITGSGWSEAEFDFIEAVQEQIGYFNTIGAKDAELFSVRRLAGLYSNAIRKGRHAELRGPLRRLLARYHVPVLKNEHLYRVARPIRMMWLWPMLRLTDVLKRRGLLGTINQCSLRVLHRAKRLRTCLRVFDSGENR